MRTISVNVVRVIPTKIYHENFQIYGIMFMKSLIVLQNVLFSTAIFHSIWVF